MSKPSHAFVALMAATVLVAACAPAPGRSTGNSAESASLSGSPTRALNVAIRYELRYLVPKIYQSGVQDQKSFFNAALTLTDDSGTLRPYLAEVPQLNTDTWQVFPDGRMETTYQLRPGLTWHDGEPLTAEDFAFSWRVYTNPAVGEFTRSPQDLMEAVTAADPRTLVIRWRGPYPDANAIVQEDLDPLPLHLLGQPFASLPETGPDAFFSLPFWRSEYVNAGPYRLVHWEPGSYFEGEAFDAYVLGRPKIRRLIVRVIADENATLTSILAGDVDMSVGGTLRFEHGQVLMRDWVPGGKGFVVFNRGGAQTEWVQLRPEYVGHAALLDLRVRQGLAHSLDRQAINEGVFEGLGFMTDSMVPPNEPFYADVDRALPHYPYDLRRTEQLMGEAGLAKDHDGFFANGSGERYWLDHVTVAGPEFERTQLIMKDGWQRAGIEVRTSALPAAQVGPGEQRHTFPGLSTRGGGRIERDWITAEIGSPGNRWSGNNRSGWSNPEYDRLYEAFLTTLDRAERTRQFAQMQRLIGENLPTFFIYFSNSVTAFGAALRGPRLSPSGTGTGTFTRGGFTPISEWEWQ